MEIGILFILAYFSLIYSVSGCGQLPGQQSRTINFEVTGFKLPAAMVYSTDNTASSKAPTISATEQQAVTFVQNIIMRSVDDVLYQQGRGAGLSDDVISVILNQLDVTVKYTPLECDIVFTTSDGNGVVMQMKKNCQIIDGTVTKTCSMPGSANGQAPFMCMPAMLEDIDQLQLTISGSITTTNVIMANWSTQMWQIVLNRALQTLTIGPLRSQFLGASIAIK